MLVDKRFSHQSKIVLIIIVISLLLISYLHYSTITVSHSLHDIYREFYYIPVLLGALFFGLKGAVAVYLAVLVLYLPYVFKSWTGAASYEINRFLQIFVQGVFAFLAGYLIDRDRRHRDQLEKERYLAGIGQAATSIVHDLKNPLITILGFTRRLREGKGSSETAIQTIEESAQNMQKIVSDVLDFAKPLQLDLKKEDIRIVINRACDTCRAKAEDAGVCLTVDFSDQPSEFMLDSFHLERAIVNIVNNAIEASGEGKEVVISLRSDGTDASIKIRDQGAGMDKETIESIFIPFYTKKAKGTGLGMPIVKKLIEGHGGDIHIESQPGVGTSVTVRLPYRLN